MSWNRKYVCTLCTILAHAGLAQAGDASRDEPVAERAEVVAVEPIDVEGAARARPGAGWLIDPEPVSADAARGLDSTVFVTVVRVDERAGESTSVAEVMAESLGVHVRSLGGLGSFSSISVRGAAAGHTAVFIDGVPLARIASVGADLGRLSMDSLSAIELYRGGVPVELGGAALGGALNLVTPVGPARAGEQLVISAGGGSFGTRHARARWLGGDERGSSGERARGIHLSLGYAGTSGNFPYYDDKGTNLVLEDDEYVERRNNGHDQVDAVARARIRRGATTLTAGSRSLWRVQGLPGRGSAQSDTASSTTLSQLFDAQITRQGLWGSPRLMGAASSYASLEWQRYEDRDGEARLGVQDARQWWVSAGGVARLSMEAGDAHVVSAALDLRFEHAADRDALMDATERHQGWRTGAALSVADEIALGDQERVVLQPAVRLDWLHTVPISDRNQPVVGDGALEPRTDVFLSPRVAGRVRLTPALTAKASAGWYFREPTAPELFGGRGVHVGNPALRPEHGLSSDAGLVLAWPRAAAALDRIHVESAVFLRRPRDTILYRSTLGGAFNVGDALMYGVETGASARVARAVTMSANYTWLETRQDSPLPSYDGKPLPYAPRHRFYGRVDAARALGGRVGVIWADLTWTAGNYLDLAGAVLVPRRRFVGAGLKLELRSGLLAGIEGKNLTNERVETVTNNPAPRPDLARVPRAISDFHGYPLPGRALYLTVEWKQ